MIQELKKNFNIDEIYPSVQDVINIYPIPAVIVHSSNTILFANQRFANLHQSSLKEMLGRNIGSFSESAAESVIEYFSILREGKSLSMQEKYVNGYYYRILIHPIYNTQNKIEALFCLQWNISKIKRFQQLSNQNNKRYKEQLYIDQLTGINNDHALDAYIVELTRQTQYSHIRVLLIDIDAFGDFNSEHGFSNANLALYSIAQTLKRELRHEKDFLAKLSSDRFLIVFPEMSHLAAFTIAERLRQSVYDLNLQHQMGMDQRLTISLILHQMEVSKLSDLDQILHLLGEQLGLNKKNDRNQSIVYKNKYLINNKNEKTL